MTLPQDEPYTPQVGDLIRSVNWVPYEDPAEVIGVGQYRMLVRHVGGPEPERMEQAVTIDAPDGPWVKVPKPQLTLRSLPEDFPGSGTLQFEHGDRLYQIDYHHDGSIDVHAYDDGEPLTVRMRDDEFTTIGNIRFGEDPEVPSDLSGDHAEIERITP